MSRALAAAALAVAGLLASRAAAAPPAAEAKAESDAGAYRAQAERRERAGDLRGAASDFASACRLAGRAGSEASCADAERLRDSLARAAPVPAPAGAAPPADGATARDAARARELVRTVAERALAVEDRLDPRDAPREDVLRAVEADVVRLAEERGPGGRLRRVWFGEAEPLALSDADVEAEAAKLGRGCPALAGLGAGRAFLARMDPGLCDGLLHLAAVDAAAAARLPDARRAELRWGETLSTQPGRHAAEGWDLFLAYLRRQAAERGGAKGKAWAVPPRWEKELARRTAASFARDAEAAWRKAGEDMGPHDAWVTGAGMAAALAGPARPAPAWTADTIALSRAPWEALRRVLAAPTARDLPPLSPWAAEVLVERLLARAAAGLEAGPAPAPAARPWFREIPAEASGLVMPPREAPRDDRLTDQMPGGLAVLDYDGDGKPDLLLCDFDQARLFRNLGGFKFRDATAEAGLTGASCRNGASSADFDGDGRPDLLLLHGRGDRDSLWRNEGGRFRDATAGSGLSTAPAQSTSAVWLDFDGDGRLDVFVLEYGDLAFASREPDPGDAKNGLGHRLYRNLGGGRFADVTAAAGIADTGWGLPAAAFDADGDGRPDLLVSNDFGRPVLYRNRGDGTFADATSSSGLASFGNGMGVSVADYDGDGIPDVFLTYIGDARPAAPYLFPDAHPRIKTETMDLRAQRDRLYRGRGDGTFEERPGDIDDVPTGWGWNGFFLDAANSGFQDLYQVNGWWPYRHLYDADAHVFWRWDPEGRRFRDVSPLSGLDFAANSRVAAAEDFDGDGCLDVIATGFHAPRLFAGDCPKANHWLEVRLEGTRSNRDGLGAKATARAGGRSWTAELGPQGGGFQNSPRRVLRFGLGAAARVDALEVRWPDGARQTAGPFDADRAVVLREGGAR